MPDSEIQRTLGSLESKLDSLLTIMAEHKSLTHTEVTDLKKRVNDLEIFKARAVSYVIGASAVLGFLYTLAFEVIGTFR